MSVSNVFNIAKLSLQAQQVALQVAGNNIANVNTPGYSRQQVVLAETPPTDGNPGQIGTGVQASEILRKYDRFIEAQISEGKQEFGNLETQKGVLSRVEILFNDAQGGGLQQAIDDLFQSFQDLSNNPEGTAERQMVLTRAETLSSLFNQMGNELNQIQEDVDDQVSQTVTDINGLTSQIADLNEKIMRAEIGGQNANDYRDMRERVLKELSSEIDIRFFEDDSGQLTVFAAGVANLVEGNTSRNLSVVSNGANNGYYDVVYDTGTGTGTNMNITSDITGGALKGLISTRDTIIPDISDQVDLLAYTMVSDINAQHQAGYGLDGSMGNSLFTVLAGSADASVNMAVAITDTDLVAASSTLMGLPGDNTNALALAQLQNQLTMNVGQATFNEFYNAVVQNVGSTVQQVDRSFDAQEFSLQQMENMREAASGVSLDEEMANLVMFQRTFEASAKLITLADDMLKTVIDMV